MQKYMSVEQKYIGVQTQNEVFTQILINPAKVKENHKKFFININFQPKNIVILKHKNSPKSY